jgi:hypothetical protein
VIAIASVNVIVNVIVNVNGDGDGDEALGGPSNSPCRSVPSFSGLLPTRLARGISHGAVEHLPGPGQKTV